MFINPNKSKYIHYEGEMQAQNDISKSETADTTKRILNDLVLEQYTASMNAQQVYIYM
jgi:hypothetical protein